MKTSSQEISEAEHQNGCCLGEARGKQLINANDMDIKQFRRNRNSFQDSESEYLLSDREDTGEFNSLRDGKQASNLRKLCVYISCLVQLFVCYGIGYGLNVMFPVLVTVFDADRSIASLIQSLNMGVNCACGILLMFVIKKTGPGVAVLVGSVLASLALFASSFATDITTIIICTGFLAGIFMGLCQFSSFITITWLFHTDPSLFLITLTTGISLGQLAFPSLYDMFISNYSWSGTFILLAGLMLQCVPFGLIIHFSKHYYVSEDDSNERGKSVTFCHVSLFIDIVIWILWINALLLGQTGNLEPWFLVDHMIDRGFSRSDGAFTASVMGGGNLVGKVIGAALKFGCKKTTTLCHWIYLGIFLAGLHAVIVFLYNLWGLVIACALFGCVVGLMWSQVGAITYEVSGLDRYPQALAVLHLMIGIGNVIGATSGGYIKDTYGAYDINFFIAVGVSVYISLSTGVAVVIAKNRGTF